MTTFPEMIEHLQVDLNIHKDDLILFYQLNDRVNEIFGCVLGIADLTAPIFGNLIHKEMGMAIFDLMALLSFINAFILFIFNCGCSFIRNDKKFKLQLKKMRDTE